MTSALWTRYGIEHPRRKGSGSASPAKVRQGVCRQPHPSPRVRLPHSPAVPAPRDPLPPAGTRPTRRHRHRWPTGHDGGARLRRPRRGGGRPQSRRRRPARRLPASATWPSSGSGYCWLRWRTAKGSRRTTVLGCWIGYWRSRASTRRPPCVVSRPTTPPRTASNRSTEISSTTPRPENAAHRALSGAGPGVSRHRAVQRSRSRRAGSLRGGVGLRAIRVPLRARHKP